MLIGLDGNEANVQRRVGVGRYAYELLKQFHKLRRADCEWRIYLKEKPLMEMPLERLDWKYEIIGPKKFWTQFGLPLNLYRQKRRFGVFFTPSHYAPRFSPYPTVVSIMDLAYLHFPEMFRQKDLWQLRHWTSYSVKKAVRVLTISESSRRDIINHYQVPKEKVIVTYPGFEMETKQPFLKSQLRADYILSVGTLQPRKNFVRLIEAFAKLDLPNLELVIVGKPGWLYEEIYQAPKRFKVEGRVKFLNFVTDEELAILYRRAKCFVLVSLYEGFGIPALEAMGLSCPVVVSNVSSLPEVVGEAGILVDPYRVEEIAQGIKRAIQEREVWVKKGLRQCRRFSWERCAQETLKVLKEVGSSVGGK